MTAPNSTLTPEQLDAIRQELHRTMARLQRSSTANRGGNVAEIDQGAVGRLSRIEAIQSRSLAREVQERERLQMEQVDQALQRIASGCYGICTGCRAPIRFERLLVYPETCTCSGCAEQN